MRAILLFLLLGTSLPVCAAIAVAGYTAKPLSQLAIYPESRALAQVVAENESRIAAEVSARIQQITVRLGQSVRKGAILVKLDQRQYQLSLEQAGNQVNLLQNRYKLAELQFAQAKALHASQFVSAQVLEQRRTEMAVLDSEIKIARHGVAQAKLSLEKTTLRAPFAGTVKERLAGEGELAAPGQPIVTLVEESKNELRARVPQRDIAALKGDKAPVFKQSGQTFPAKIVRIAAVIDPKAQTRDVILQAEQALVSGSAGELVWASNKPHLPAAYVQQRGAQLGVWVEEAGKPLFKPLPQAQNGRPVPVDWPLATRVIDAGRFALANPPAASAK
ncbi:MAG: efflux RND transporter periplasmic adaptor subunit [Burkholderiaceae bacterium]